VKAEIEKIKSLVLKSMTKKAEFIEKMKKRT
jgi:hypothetical protein